LYEKTWKPRNLFLLLALAIALLAAALYAGTPRVDAIDIAPDRGAAGMSRWLRSLQTRASLLMVTAHPDDEDGGMLAFESRGLGARVGLLTLNGAREARTSWRWTSTTRSA